MVWFISSKKHYKIWFSKDRTCFLDTENRLRFLGERQLNPDAHFTLVYSATCLDSAAKHQLSVFCEENKIIALDFDAQVLPLLDHEYDKKLYEYVIEEIQRYGHNLTGNLVAAANCARFILPLIAKCGISSGFSSNVNFATFGLLIKVLRPFLIPPDLLWMMGLVSAPNANSNLVIAAVDTLDSTILHADAIDAIRALQAQIIQQYLLIRDLHSALKNTYKKTNPKSAPDLPVNFNEQNPYYTVSFVDEIKIPNDGVCLINFNNTD